MRDIGERIRTRRKQLGWSVQKLATLAEIDNGFLSKLETGKSSGSWETYTKLAGALGLSLESLFVTKGNVVEAPADWRAIPVLSYQQAAQWPPSQGLPQDLPVRETVMTHLEHTPSTFALRIEGDSMEPEFREGELVVIAPSIPPRPGDYVVASDANGETNFRQYRQAGLNDKGQQVFELHPLNAIYPVMRSDRQAIALIGTMVEHRRYRRR